MSDELRLISGKESGRQGAWPVQRTITGDFLVHLRGSKRIRVARVECKRGKVIEDAFCVLASGIEGVGYSFVDYPNSIWLLRSGSK